MQKFKYLTAIALVMVSCAAANANDHSKPHKAPSATSKSTKAKLSQTDLEFAKNAAIGDMFEIQSSRLALERSQKPEIRSMAEMIIADHTNASAELKTITGAAKLPKTLDTKHADMLAELKATPDAAFESKYIMAQEKAHDEAIGLYTGYINTVSSNEDLHAFAVKTLPKLQEHKEMVLNNRIQPSKPKSMGRR